MEYDPAHKLEIGYWKCSECQGQWYGGRQRHYGGCAEPRGAVYVFGPEEGDLTPDMRALMKGGPDRLDLLLESDDG